MFGEAFVRPKGDASITAVARNLEEPPKANFVIRGQVDGAQRRLKGTVDFSPRSTQVGVRPRGGADEVAHATSLEIEPTLEFRRVGDVKSLKQLALVSGHRRREIACSNQGLDLECIAVDARWVDADKPIASCHDDRVADGLTNGMQRVAKRVPSAGFIGFGPEQRDECVA
jgi:hypothetical protein